ncbi:unnamed protein product [Schistocephalus solidus]|uniref:Arginine kinase n=1 Tax=Schistocephalus solidus TaxID=70667 RepID=A0A183SXD5_SCHSO|nr:unnamed protein product [Schistocephalus solidus]
MAIPDLTKLYTTIHECSENHSITKNHLTQDVVNKYASVKTKFGGTLAQCVNHNASNPGALLPRCADSDCYTVFADFFDAVIRDYHKVTTPKISHPPANFGDLQHLPFGDLSIGNDLVISTRVRLGRTVKGYGFAPVISKEDRIALEQKIVAALKTLPGEFAGDYYSLGNMTKTEYDSLVKDHFLFRDDDSVLRDAGGYRDWPSGRGIFINKKKNFLVWVNEEDHIRIISMQQGGNLAEVYTRLAEAAGYLERQLEFEKDERFGYLTFCPSNLGTTMRASVHAKIPLVSALPNYKQLCEKYHMQSRGTFGEHTATVGGVYDLSNKRRLGLTELEAVTEMAAGVKALLTLEKMMEEYNKNMPASTWAVEPLEYLSKMILDAPDSRCICKKYLTPDTIKQFDGKRTKFGTTLAHMIRNCAYNPRALCPRLGDAECYETFKGHMEHVIRDYHRVQGDKISHPVPTFGDLSKLPFKNLDPSGKLIISTRVRVGRSVQGYQFGTTINKEARVQLEKELADALMGLTGEHAGTYYSLAGMDEATRKQLVEDHFLFKDDDSVLRDAGGYRDWPAGRGIFHNASKTFLCWIGEEDHLRIISMELGGDLAGIYTRLVKGIQAIEQKVKFCHSDNYGYLTCCPSNLGTTMRASVHARVPKLSANKAKFDEVCKKYGIQARGKCPLPLSLLAPMLSAFATFQGVVDWRLGTCAGKMVWK